MGLIGAESSNFVLPTLPKFFAAVGQIIFHPLFPHLGRPRKPPDLLPFSICKTISEQAYDNAGKNAR